MSREQRLLKWAEELTKDQLVSAIVEVVDRLVVIEEVVFRDDGLAPFWNSCGSPLVNEEIKDRDMSEFKDYRKKNVQPMRPYVVGEDLTDISVSAEDTPEEGGMIAVNPDNEVDKWYVGKQFFQDNYEET